MTEKEIDERVCLAVVSWGRFLELKDDVDIQSSGAGGCTATGRATKD
jgi:hypothetical protein